MGKAGAGVAVGIADHCGWAVVVSITPHAELLDRRRVELVDTQLPKLPHHCEGQQLPEANAVALVEHVQASAMRHCRARLDELEASISGTIKAIALRECPELPPTIAERISDYRAQNVADSVMYRDALARAAMQLGWQIYWYNRKTVFEEAAHFLGVDDITALIAAVRGTMGPPWQKDHRVAMAAALAAMGRQH